MIGLDTNILLRAMLDDDPVQSAAARKLMSSFTGDRPGLISLTVLMELFWVLRSRYKVPRERIAASVRHLLEVEHIEFESLDTVGKALAAYENGSADFPDMVIAMRNKELGAIVTMTFDERAAHLTPSMELLS